MIALLTLAVATVGVYALASVTWRGRGAHRRCPTCRVPYVVVAHAGEGDNATYDVLACPQCANTVTLVHGAQSHLAYCPACRNRALETPSVRLPGEPPQVEVREHCHLCGFQRTFTVGAQPGMGKVLPFPTARPRRRAGNHDR
ncbi:MAG: hypothetical protein H6732_04520 [Alphaproteobacteria bacterium]|nr:hypothetical protein [Alphaproteobacteria bacterium]